MISQNNFIYIFLILCIPILRFMFGIRDCPFQQYYLQSSNLCFDILNNKYSYIVIIQLYSNKAFDEERTRVDLRITVLVVLHGIGNLIGACLKAVKLCRLPNDIIKLNKITKFSTFYK